jgi:hypothetical protein
MLVAKRHGCDISECERCLQIAVAEAEAERFFTAWDNVHRFDIAFLATLDDEGRRLAWHELSAEASEKLAGWRVKAGEAMRRMVDANQVPSLQLLAKLRAQLAMQAQNSALKREMLHRRVPIVLFGSVATIVFFLITAALGWYEALVHSLAEPLLLGVLAAVLGGVISVAVSIRTANVQAKVPEFRFTMLVTLLRPAVGALCAIPVVFLVYSGFLTFGHMSATWTSVVLCLITGFSERWFLGVMERVTAGDK